MSLTSRLRYGLLAGLAGIIMACSSGGDDSSSKGCNLVTNYGCGSGFKCVPDENGEGVCVKGDDAYVPDKDTSEKDNVLPEIEKQCYGPWLWRECEQGTVDNCSSWSETYTCPTSTICRDGICEEILWDCYNGPAIKLDKVCDGVKDCSLGDDEEGCYDNFSNSDNCEEIGDCFDGKKDLLCEYSNDYSKDLSCWIKCWGQVTPEAREEWVTVTNCMNLECGGMELDICLKGKESECTHYINGIAPACGVWSDIFDLSD